MGKIDSVVKEHTNTLEFVSDKIRDIEKVVIPGLEEKLNKKIESLESQNMYQEMRSRKYNLIFHGLQTSKAASVYEYTETLKEFFVLY